MRSWRRSYDAITYRRVEQLSDARNMKIARCGAKAVPRQPQLNITRLDLADLGQLASRPVRLDSSDDEAFSLNRFRILMLNCFQIAVAQIGRASCRERR